MSLVRVCEWRDAVCLRDCAAGPCKLEGVEIALNTPEQGDVEKVARIVDDEAFDDWARLSAYKADKGNDPAEQRRVADHYHKPRCDAARAKAREIIAALKASPAPLQGDQLAKALGLRCYVTSGKHLSGWTLTIGFSTLAGVQAAHEAVVRAPRGCVNHPAEPVREVLDGDPLCQACCDAWVRAEGDAALSTTGEE